MKNFVVIVFVLLSISFTACSDSQKLERDTAAMPDSSQQSASEELPAIEVYTLGKVNEDIRNAMIDSLKSIYPRCRYISCLPLPKSAWYPPRQRYLADSLVNYLAKHHTKHNVVVGLTEVDISIALHGASNYGIMGLTNRVGGGVCVLSTYRKKDRKGLFCLMKHELGHAFGLKHCSTSGCLMHDAEGSDLKGSSFCPSCASFLRTNGWEHAD